MITERDLQEAIAECQAVENPNANTCIKLAAFLTIKKQLYDEKEEQYSYASVSEELIDYYSDTEFGKAVEGKDSIDVLSVIDEMMTALQVLNPRLYEGVMRKIRSLQ